MALHGNDANETNNFPSTIPELLKILPKRETTLHIRMGDSSNNILNQSTTSSNANNRHNNHHGLTNRRHNNSNNSSSSNTFSSSNSSTTQNNNNNNSQNNPSYHTLRYDFKPASINSEEPATLELTQNGQVTIKAPNVGGSISSQTVFRGQKRPHVKECLLVINNSTGEMVLQKLTDNITVKATRSLGGGGGGTTTSSTSGSNNTGNSSNSNNTSTSAMTTSNSTTTVTTPASLSTMPQLTKMDGPQLSEESSSSDDSSSTSSSSSSSSSSNSGNSSPNNEGFTF